MTGIHLRLVCPFTGGCLLLLIAGPWVGGIAWKEEISSRFGLTLGWGGGGETARPLTDQIG